MLKKANQWVCVFGAPGQGKSTYALASLRKSVGYRVIQDGTGSLDDLPTVATMRECSRHWSRHPRDVVCVLTTDGETFVRDIVDYARATGEKRKWPIWCVLDEGCLISGASEGRLSQPVRELLLLRRHLNIGVWITSQSPSRLHYEILSNSTKIVCFRINSRKAIPRLEEVGFYEAVKVLDLPEHQAIEYDPATRKSFILT